MSVAGTVHLERHAVDDTKEETRIESTQNGKQGC